MHGIPRYITLIRVIGSRERERDIYIYICICVMCKYGSGFRDLGVDRGKSRHLGYMACGLGLRLCKLEVNLGSGLGSKVYGVKLASAPMR